MNDYIIILLNDFLHIQDIDKIVIIFLKQKKTRLL